jgi:transglutaminase-like putative cysteine protease
LHREKRERDLEFAWRVFSLLSQLYQYEYKAEQDRRASLICATNRTDCGGISGLFVSTMRANSVPARMLFGTWAHSDPPGKQLANAHVKAEFYAEGIGWVPVELSAMTGTNRPANPMDCFGTFNADFVTFHVDPDFVIDTGPFGRQNISWLQLPGVWAAGSGNFDGTYQNFSWTVR